MPSVDVDKDKITDRVYIRLSDSITKIFLMFKFFIDFCLGTFWKFVNQPGAKFNVIFQWSLRRGQGKNRQAQNLAM